MTYLVSLFYVKQVPRCLCCLKYVSCVKRLHTVMFCHAKMKKTANAQPSHILTGTYTAHCLLLALNNFNTDIFFT